MKYEKGDKVVVEIDKEDADLLNGGYSPNCLYFEQFLGKLEDFTEAKKIKMTVEEKKEFDNLLKRHPTADLNDFLKIILDYPKTYPALRKKLFGNLTAFLDRKKQLGFARALENPDLIEVDEPEKYLVTLPNGQYVAKTEAGTYQVYSEDPRDYNKLTKEEAREAENSEAIFWIEKASDNLKGRIPDIKYNKVIVTIKDSELKKINWLFINHIARYLLKQYLNPENVALTLNLKDNLFNTTSKVLASIGGTIKYNIDQNSNEIVFLFNKQGLASRSQMRIYEKLTNSSLDAFANNTVYISLNKLISLISGEEQ